MLLTDGDQKILPLALRENGGFHIATQWYLNFDPLPYQYAWHHALTPNTTLLAGIAAGKTRIATGSCFIDCVSIPFFKCLNTSVTAKQAQLAFDMFMEYYESNDRVQRLVENISLRPWPIVKFKIYSEWEFRTSGQGARFIRGHEYDRIVCDEFGLEYTDDAIKVLRGRLRGIRPDGRPRMGRMDVITSPTDAPWLRERYDRGEIGNPNAELKDYLSFRITTYDNTKLPPDQIRLMEAEYSDEMADVELRAMFPDYGMSMFPKKHIIACTNKAINDQIYLALNPEDEKEAPKRGYLQNDHPRHGTTRLEIPFQPSRQYILAGDPGTDDPPRNNAGVVVAFDVTSKPYKMVYFDWVSGYGSYMPFLQSYKYAIEKYRPYIKAIDSTSTQKGIQELAFENVGIQTDGINFSTNKDAMLNSLSLAITNHELQWPFISGLDKQLSSYTRENDKKNDFPKDITMCMAMAAYAARFVSTDEPAQPRSTHYPRRAGRKSRGRSR